MVKKFQGNKKKLEEIEEAFAVLSNKEKRELYDKKGEAAFKEEEEEEEEVEGEPEEEEGFQNLFDILRGRGGGAGKKAKPRRNKMKPMQFALEATLDEIYSGAINKQKVKRMRLCKTCHG